MLSVTPTRREMLVWLVAALTIFVAITTFRSKDAQAGLTSGAQTDVVFIATGLNYPDALGAGSPAALGLGPILLVQQDAIPQPTLDELNRLQPQRVVIVGGLSAISQNVQNAIDALAFNPVVTRISGNNRYETAAELSQSIFPTTGKYPRIAVTRLSNAPDTVAGVAVDVTSTQILVPDHGFLYITAIVDTNFDTVATTFSCWLWSGDNTLTIFGTTMISDLDSTNTEENCSSQSVVVVEPGLHIIGFRMQSVADIDALNASLIVMWIPFGDDGYTPEPS